MIDRVELAKALWQAWNDAPDRSDPWARVADKALELLAPKPAPEATGRETDRLVEALRNYRMKDYDDNDGWKGLAERLRKIVLEEIGDTQTAALRSRFAQLEREAACYQEEIAGLRKAAADRSDLASEVTALRAKLSSVELRAEHWKRRFRDMLGLAAELAEGAK